MERLSGLDAAFLYLETPQMHMHVGMVAVLDPKDAPGGCGYERVIATLDSAISRMPVMRRRLIEVPLRIHHPVWVDDPHFDLLHHVRRVSCAAPGGTHELAELSARIMSVPLDRNRPLWEMWVIDGLEAGRFALLMKIHHAGVDGASGMGLLAQLFTFTRDAQLPAPTAKSSVPDPLPEPYALARQAIKARLELGAQLKDLGKRTRHALEAIQERARADTSDAGAGLFGAPRTFFNGSIGSKRAIAFARVSLADLKAIKLAFGGTLNDVILGVTSGAVRSWLETRGELPLAPLVVACPVSVRKTRTTTEATNRVSFMFASLATNLEDPEARLRAIREATAIAKREHSSVGGALVKDLAEVIPPNGFRRAMRMYAGLKLANRHRPMYNLCVSNVPGPPVPMYFAGAELLAGYPLGPVLEGSGLNITVLSYRGHVDFGLVVDPSLISDVWRLAEAIAPAVAELVSLARASQQPQPERSP